MQIMFEKGLVTRDQSSRTHIYSASSKQEDTQKKLVDNLLDKAFGGSAQKLVMQALRSKKVPAKELDKIQKMLDKLGE